MKKLITKALSIGLNTLATVAPEKAGKAGFNLFCYPFRGKLNNKQLEFLNSAEKFTLHHKGNTIQGFKWGIGPKNILLLHGWQSHSYRWKAYIEAIDKTRFSIYAIDAPGHGLSSGKFMSVPLYSEVIEKVIDQIGKVEAVVAHSIGSFTALYTFHRKPALTPQKLVLTASPGEATEFFDFFKSQLKLGDKTMAFVLERFKKVVGEAPEFFSAPVFAQHLEIPGLIIHDENDDETSVHSSIAIHNAWKNSVLHITKGKGHNLKSVEVVNEVVRFVEVEEFAVQEKMSR